MQTVIDLEKVLAKWQKDIDFHQDKIREIRGKMELAKEMVSISSSDIPVSAIPVRTPTLSSARPGTLPDAIIKTLADRNDWLTAAEVAAIIKEGGFESDSGNFKLLVSSTINKMNARKRVAKRKIGTSVTFATNELAASTGDKQEETLFKKK